MTNEPNMYGVNYPTTPDCHKLDPSRPIQLVRYLESIGREPSIVIATFENLEAANQFGREVFGWEDFTL